MHAVRRDAGSLALMGVAPIRGVLAGAAASAMSYADALESAKRSLPADALAFLPDVPVEEFAQYALDADSWTAHPVEAATTIARSYLVDTVGPTVAELVTNAILSTAGAVFGSVAAVSIIGGAVGQIVTTMTDKALDQLTHANVDTFIAPDGSRMPEVDDQIARWARPEVAAQVTDDLHNMGQYEGGGPLLVAFGRALIGWNDTSFKVRWEHGVYDWARPERLGGLPYATGLPVAGKAFVRDLAYGASLYQSRRAKEATAKAALVATALRFLTAPRVASTTFNRSAVAASTSTASGGVNLSAVPASAWLAAAAAANKAKSSVAPSSGTPAKVAGGFGLAAALALAWWLL